MRWNERREIKPAALLSRIEPRVPGFSCQYAGYYRPPDNTNPLYAQLLVMNAQPLVKNAQLLVMNARHSLVLTMLV